MADDVTPIDYVELAGGDLTATKAFYAQAFGWAFTDYGPEYAAIANAGLDGGFSATDHDPPLVVLKTDDLEAAHQRVVDAGAEITRPIFDFPGGRRFQFKDPAGNELGVWAE